MSKKFSGAADKTMVDESSSANTATQPNPLPQAVEGTICPHRGNGGSYVVDSATQTLNPNQPLTEE